jgi:hypothetical protein
MKLYYIKINLKINLYKITFTHAREIKIYKK